MRPVWEWSGLKQVYRTVVVGLAEPIVVATQHFPTVASLSNLTTQNLDFVVLLALSLMLVSTRLAWPRRLKLFGVALAVILALQVVLFALWVEMTAAQELEQAKQILVLSPAGFQIMQQLKLILYDFGQPATMFALLIVTFAWNTGLTFSAPTDSKLERQRPRVRGWRRGTVLGLVLGLAMASIVGCTVWGRWRELDPRHVEAHAKLGHLFWAQRDKTTAEEQYRIAVAGGTLDPEVFYNLAEIAHARGRMDESRGLLQRCAGLTTDPAWKRRVERALAP